MIDFGKIAFCRGPLWLFAVAASLLVGMSVAGEAAEVSPGLMAFQGPTNDIDPASWLLSDTAWRPVSAEGLSPEEVAKLPSLTLTKGVATFAPAVCADDQAEGHQRSGETVTTHFPQLRLAEPFSDHRRGHRRLGSTVQVEEGMPEGWCHNSEKLAGLAARLIRYEISDASQASVPIYWDRSAELQLRFFEGAGREPSLVYARDKSFDFLAERVWDFVTIDRKDPKAIFMSSKRWEQGQAREAPKGSIVSLRLDRSGRFRIFGTCNRNSGLLTNIGAGTWQFSIYYQQLLNCLSPRMDVELVINAMLRLQPVLQLHQDADGLSLVSTGDAGKIRLVGHPDELLPQLHLRLSEMAVATIGSRAWPDAGFWGDGRLTIGKEAEVTLEIAHDHLDIRSRCGLQRMDIVDGKDGALLLRDTSPPGLGKCEESPAKYLHDFFRNGGFGVQPAVVFFNIAWGAVQFQTMAGDWKFTLAFVLDR